MFSLRYADVARRVITARIEYMMVQHNNHMRHADAPCLTPHARCCAVDAAARLPRYAAARRTPAQSFDIHRASARRQHAHTITSPCRDFYSACAGRLDAAPPCQRHHFYFYGYKSVHARRLCAAAFAFFFSLSPRFSLMSLCCCHDKKIETPTCAMPYATPTPTPMVDMLIF